MTNMFEVTFEREAQGLYRVKVDGAATAWKVASAGLYLQAPVKGMRCSHLVMNDATGRIFYFGKRRSALQAARTYAKTEAAETVRAAAEAIAKAKGITLCEVCEEVQNDAGEWVPGVVTAAGYLTATDLDGTVLDRKALCEECMRGCHDVEVGNLGSRR